MNPFFIFFPSSTFWKGESTDDSSMGNSALKDTLAKTFIAKEDRDLLQR